MTSAPLTPDQGPSTPLQSARPATTLRTVVPSVVAAVLIVFLLLLGIGHAAGARAHRVTTPSMGTWAPVGTLLVSRPADAADLVPGRVVVFTNPAGRTYSHRIVAVKDGAITTKGDINGSVDPWTLHASDVTGAVWFRLRYAGYLLQAMPWLVGGLLLTELLVRFALPGRWRQRSRFLLGFLTLDVASVAVHPFTGAVAMGFTPVTKAGMQAIVVATGIFPLRVQGAGGTHADLHQGEVGFPVARVADAAGHYQFVPGVHMSWPWWLGVGVVCLLPLAWCLLHGLDDPHDPPDVPDDPGASGGTAAMGATAMASDPAARRPFLPGLARLRSGHSGVGVTVLSGVLGLTTAFAMATPAQAGFTARITNSQNTAGTRQFFTCLDAMDAYATKAVNALYTGHTVGDGTGVSGTTDQQTVSGQSYTLRITGGSQTTDVGCQSDYRKRQQQAYVLDGATKLDLGGLSSISEVTANPGKSDRMTWQEWFKTTTTTGGILACSANSSSVCGDRSTWMATNGHVVFGVGSTELTSTKALNDGTWHMVVTQLGSGGMKMWVDGVLDQTNPSITSGSATIQYPQWGYSSGALPSGLANQPSTLYFTGRMQMLAVYGIGASGAQLGDADVAAIYQSAF